ncbi:MAG: carbohydrate ABC transporter permease [Chloroflexi bacterium]|nr:carbohydrate ABC transporter permease [Chloroflexota bacterium]
MVTSSWQRYLVQPIVIALLGIGALWMIIPFGWMALSTIKPAGEILSVPPTFLPSQPTLDNYVQAFEKTAIQRWYVNSAVVTLTVTFSALLVSSLGGFVFAKYQFPGRDLIFLVILGTMMIPFEVIMVPLYKLFVDLGMNNTYAGLIVPGLVSTFGLFMMRQFMHGVPDELLDAATIDGCSELQKYYRIVLPLVKPPLGTLGIFTFMWNWDSFLWPLLIITRGELTTLPLGIAAFIQESGTTYNVYFAAALLALLPVLIVFFLGQKQIVRGVALTGMR